MKLHLGVRDVPHDLIGTGDLAQTLEKEYGVFAGYVELHGQEIMKALMGGLDTAMKEIGAGNTAVLTGEFDIFGQATSEIAKGFQEYLNLEEIAQLGRQGVPTKAALMGVRSHKGVKKTGERRPSFIDTGIYQNSAAAWVEYD
jgi:hypothetical protein